MLKPQTSAHTAHRAGDLQATGRPGRVGLDRSHGRDGGGGRRRPPSMACNPIPGSERSWQSLSSSPSRRIIAVCFCFVQLCSPCSPLLLCRAGAGDKKKVTAAALATLGDESISKELPYLVDAGKQRPRSGLKEEPEEASTSKGLSRSFSGPNSSSNSPEHYTLDDALEGA